MPSPAGENGTVWAERIAGLAASAAPGIHAGQARQG